MEEKKEKRGCQDTDGGGGGGVLTKNGPASPLFISELPSPTPPPLKPLMVYRLYKSLVYILVKCK